MSDIAGWLEEIGLGKYAEAFRPTTSISMCCLRSGWTN
jgi:hypothetical protein